MEQTLDVESAVNRAEMGDARGTRNHLRHGKMPKSFLEEEKDEQKEAFDEKYSIEVDFNHHVFSHALVLSRLQVFHDTEDID
jgi:hypothetical protein